jgi:hypothetical protein
MAKTNSYRPTWNNTTILILHNYTAETIELQVFPQTNYRTNGEIIRFYKNIIEQNITDLRHLNKKEPLIRHTDYQLLLAASRGNLQSRYGAKSLPELHKLVRKGKHLHVHILLNKYRKLNALDVKSTKSDQLKEAIRERLYSPIWLIKWSNAKRFYNRSSITTI